MNNLKRIAAADAGISNENISEKALQVVADLQQAGYQAYLVGGCVRDLLIGTKPKDFDVSTDARPDQIKALFGSNARIIGRRFKIVHVRFGREVIEVATFRADANDRKQVGRNEMTEGDQGQLLRDNVFGTLEEDVIRRDFTVNALYYDSVAGEIIDFMDGIEDIKAKKLRSIGAPEQRFTEDPVRMLRVIRFSAKLGFSMEDEALTMIEEQGDLLSHVSNARLFEEVLKLFHGGAAYETYLLLRKWGLFKYLFPFTDAIAVDGAEGLPERALQNTDKRVQIGKPVIPAFLFACMMWDPVRADAQTLMDEGTNESNAWRIAMNDALRDQNQYVAVPRRLADIILDIWNIHFRLIKRNPRMVKACLNNRRFRAAYDFLLLRHEVHEIESDLVDWWTRIQEVDNAEREEMVAVVSEIYKAQRQTHVHNGEPDGNSVNYNSVDYNGSYESSPSFDDGYGNKQGNSQNRTRNRSQRPQNKSGGRNQRNSRNKNTQANGDKKKRHSQSRTQNGRPAQNKNRNRGKAAGHNPNNRRGPARRRNNNNNEGRFQEARPADEYGVTSNDNGKKVKVRRKRRIPGSSESSVDDTPHF